MHSTIAQQRTGIATICQRFRVSYLEVFGSAGRAYALDPATSGVDFLIEFTDGSAPGLQDFFWCEDSSEAFSGSPGGFD